MDLLFGIIGFIVGIFLFLFFMDRFLLISVKGLVGLFLLCWVGGIILAWIAWKIAIVVGIVALIFFIISKLRKGKSEKNEPNNDAEQEPIKNEE